jgi:hypothetical protein
MADKASLFSLWRHITAYVYGILQVCSSRRAFQPCGRRVVELIEM